MIAALERMIAADARDELDLSRFRELAPRIDRFLSEQLAAQGDHADPELIRLQHDLSALISPPTAAAALRPSTQLRSS